MGSHDSGKFRVEMALLYVEEFAGVLGRCIDLGNSFWCKNKKKHSPSQGDASTGARRLVHLAKDKSDLRVTFEVDDTSLLHFMIKIVTLTGTLTDTSEDGETTVCFGDVVLGGY